jgi:hypothetical protein
LREKQERRGEMLPKPKNVKFGSLLGVVCSLHLQNMSLPCKNSKQKLAGNAAKTPRKVTEISVYTQKFPANKYDIENIFLTSLKLIYKLKNKLE